MKPNYLKFMLTHDKNYRKFFIAAVGLPLLALLGGIIVGSNPEFFSHFFPPCGIKLFTGLNCLSCGATRATLALLRGEIITAIYYNPLYIALLCWLVYLYVRMIISLILRPYKPYGPKITIPWGIAIVVIIITFAIVRNTSFYQTIFF